MTRFQISGKSPKPQTSQRLSNSTITARGKSFTLSSSPPPSSRPEASGSPSTKTVTVRPVPVISRNRRQLTDKNYVSECGHVFIPDALFGHKLMNTGVKDTVYCDDCGEWFPARVATLRE